MAVVEFVLKNAMKKLVEDYEDDKASSILKSIDPSDIILKVSALHKDLELSDEERNEKISEVFSTIYPESFHSDNEHSEETLATMEKDLEYYQTLIAILGTIANEM